MGTIAQTAQRKPPLPAQTIERRTDNFALPPKERVVYSQLRDAIALQRRGIVRLVAGATRLSTAEVGDITATLAVAGLTAVASLRMAFENANETLEESCRTFREIVERVA